MSNPLVHEAPLTVEQGVGMMRVAQRHLSKALAEGAVDRLADWFAEDVHFYPDNHRGPIIGWTAVRTYFDDTVGALVRAGVRVTTTFHGDPDVVPAGDVLLDSGTVATTLAFPDNSVHTEITNELVVWKYVDGAWKIFRYMVNSSTI